MQLSITILAADTFFVDSAQIRKIVLLLLLLFLPHLVKKRALVHNGMDTQD